LLSSADPNTGTSPFWLLRQARWLASRPSPSLLCNPLLTSLSPDPSARRNNSTGSSRRLVPSRTSSRGQAGDTTQSERRSGSNSERSGEEEGLDSDGRPRRKRSMLDVPGQSLQANEEPSSTITGLSGDTAKDSEGSIGKGSRGSKRSITGKRRAGSTASSQRSQRELQMAQEKPGGASPATGSPTTLTDQREKKGRSGFLALLCCGLPKSGTLVDDDEEGLAAKKTTKTRPERTALPVAPKPEVSTAESSTAESKEPASEKTGESSRVQDVGVLNEKTDAQSGTHGDAAVDKLASTSGVNRKPSRGRQVYDPVIPATSGQPSRIDTEFPASQHQPQSGGPSIAVQAPTPIAPPDEEIIHDRTPQQEQRDSDIEMTDAGPSVPLSANDVSGTSEDSGPQPAHRDGNGAKIDLPPPPPLAERQAQVTPPHSPAGAGEPGQKWLLPPIKPELKGRKCLVLDLDETLVHSSFKVQTWHAPQTHSF